MDVIGCGCVHQKDTWPACQLRRPGHTVSHNGWCSGRFSRNCCHKLTKMIIRLFLHISFHHLVLLK
jgi:hypothetical protein